MTIPKDELLKNIRIQFNDIENSIRRQMGFFDDGISHISELFIEELLNIIFRQKGYFFKNLNFKKKNHPAVDLGDVENKISWQITVTNPEDINEKIKHTLESFYRHHLEKDFKELYFFTLTGKPKKINIPDTIVVNGKNLQIKVDFFNLDRIWDFNDLYNYIERSFSTTSLEEILPVIKKIPERPRQQNYELSKIHIPRTVIDNKNNKWSVIKLIEEKRNLVLMGFGGMGKSNEIDFIANIFCKKNDWICFKLFLIDYSTSLKDLINAYCKNWVNHSSSQNVLFLLDGLDEVGTDSMSTVFNECNQLLNEFEKTNILITCRNNFFHFAAADEKSHKDFKLLYLEEITEADVFEYTNKVCKHPEEFNQSMLNVKFQNLLCNPFFLTNSIDLFNRNGYIPTNKTDFFENLISLRKSREKKKTGSIHNAMHRNELDIDIALNKLAFVLQYAGKYQVSESELSRIINSYDVRILLQRIILNDINSTCEINSTWRFEHNNFQEYLAAKKLSTLTWDIVKNIIILPEYKKLRPRWLNTFSFFLNILSVDSSLFNYVINWALEFDIETLVKVETDKIDIKTREYIFKEIFNNFKVKETVIWRSSFTLEEFANFGGLNKNSKNLVNYLLGEIQKPEISLESLSNAIYLMYFVNDVTVFRSIILTQYALLLDIQYDTFGTLGRIFESFTKWNIFDKEIISTIIDKNLISQSKYARSEICNYLFVSGHEDLKANHLFNCYKSISEEKSELYYDMNNFVKLINLLSINEFQHFIMLLTTLEYRHSQNQHNTLFITITEIAASKYVQKPEIKDNILTLMYCLRNNYEYYELVAFKSFFDLTGLTFHCFKELMNKEKQEKNSGYIEYQVPCSFMDEQCIQWVAQEYTSSKLSDDDVLTILYVLRKYGTENVERFYKIINTITEDRFIDKPSLWQCFVQEKDNLMFEALLNKDKFIKYIENSFEIAGKDNLTQKEVRIFESQGEKMLDSVHNLSFELLSYFGEKTFKKVPILEKIKIQMNWDNFLVERYFILMQHSELPPKNKIWLINWIHNFNADKLDFTIHETQKEGSFTITYNRITLYYTLFSMYLGKIPSKEILLNMSKAIGVFKFTKRIDSKSTNYLLNDFILDNIEKHELAHKLMQNLKEGIKSRIVLLETVDLFGKLDFSEGVSLLIPYIENISLDKYDRLRILECFIKLNGDANLLLPTLNTLIINHEFDYKIIGYLILNKESCITDFLIKKKDDKSVDKFTLGSYLIAVNQLCGFDLIIDELNTRKKSIERIYAMNNNYLLDISIKDVDNLKLITYLIKILEAYIIRDFIKHDFDDSIYKVFSILSEIIIKYNRDMAIEITNKVEVLINSSEQCANKKNIQYIFEDFISMLKIQLDREKEIENALSEVKQLKIQF